MVLPYFRNPLTTSLKCRCFMFPHLLEIFLRERFSPLLDITIIKMETILTCKCGSKCLRQIYANGWFVISLI